MVRGKWIILSLMMPCTAALGLGLLGCSRGEAVTPLPSRSDITLAERARPSDKALAAKYDRACRICHAVQGSGAPLTGHKPSWHKRLAKGQDQLLISMKGGLGAMPPMGLCSDCTDTELVALMTFMTGDLR